MIAFQSIIPVCLVIAMVPGLRTCSVYPDPLDEYSAADKLNEIYYQTKPWIVFQLQDEINPKRNGKFLVVFKDNGVDKWVLRDDFYWEEHLRVGDTFSGWLECNPQKQIRIPILRSQVATQWQSALGSPCPVIKISGTRCVNVVKIFSEIPECAAVFVGDKNYLFEQHRWSENEMPIDFYTYIFSKKLKVVGESDGYVNVIAMIRANVAKQMEQPRNDERGQK